MALTTYETKKIFSQQRELAAVFENAGISTSIAEFTRGYIARQQRELAAVVRNAGITTSIADLQREYIARQQRELAAVFENAGISTSIAEFTRGYIARQQRELAAVLQKAGVSSLPDVSSILRNVMQDLPRLAGVPAPASDLAWRDWIEGDVAYGEESYEPVLLEVWIWFAALTPRERRALRNALGRLVLAGALLIYVVSSEPTKGEVVFASATFWFAVVLLVTAIQDTRD